MLHSLDQHLSQHHRGMMFHVLGQAQGSLLLHDFMGTGGEGKEKIIKN